MVASNLTAVQQIKLAEPAVRVEHRLGQRFSEFERVGFAQVAFGVTDAAKHTGDAFTPPSKSASEIDAVLNRAQAPRPSEPVPVVAAPESTAGTVRSDPPPPCGRPR